MTIRENAIALLVEKLREIEADADQAWKREDAWFAAIPQRTVATSTWELLDHTDSRDLHYALAFRCEQLIEAITAIPLFDQLDADDAEAEELQSARKEVATCTDGCSRCGFPGHGANDCEDERPAQEWLDAPTTDAACGIEEGDN